MTNAYYMHKLGNSYMPHTTRAKKGLQYNVVGLPNWVSHTQCLCEEAKNLIWIDLGAIDPEHNEQRVYAPPPKNAQHSAQMALNTVEGIITDPSELTSVLEEITV